MSDESHVGEEHEGTGGTGRPGGARDELPAKLRPGPLKEGGDGRRDGLPGAPRGPGAPPDGEFPAPGPPKGRPGGGRPGGPPAPEPPRCLPGGGLLAPPEVSVVPDGRVTPA